MGGHGRFEPGEDLLLQDVLIGPGGAFLGIAGAGDDHREGVLSFLEKRLADSTAIAFTHPAIWPANPYRRAGWPAAAADSCG